MVGFGVVWLQKNQPYWLKGDRKSLSSLPSVTMLMLLILYNKRVPAGGVSMFTWPDRKTIERCECLRWIPYQKSRWAYLLTQHQTQHVDTLCNHQYIIYFEALRTKINKRNVNSNPRKSYCIVYSTECPIKFPCFKICLKMLDLCVP